jgi:pimeloyl-ACP methyl ester carboxylesterase
MALYDGVLARWPVACDKLTIPTRHGETFVIASGEPSNPALVLLHGASSNSAAWAGDVAAYSRNFRVYAVDTIGEPGKSAPNSPSWAGPAYAEWLADLFGALQIETTALTGLSQGGWIALKFAITYPARVAQLVLVSPAGITPGRISFALQAIPLSLLGRWGVEPLKQLVFSGQKLPGEADTFTNLVMTYFKGRTETQPVFADAELQRLTLPVLLLAGAKDSIYNSAKTVARLRHLLPQVETWIDPEAGHLILNTTAHTLPFLAGAPSESVRREKSR